ncbi:MAG: hypothetical protein JST21_00740 [Bacteroidetes bacterium]|nr:hypothetical protein [Bacteroidota bacterium]
MKKNFFSLFISTVIISLILNACGKSANPSLFYKWDVVSDSIVSLDGSIDSQRYYTGQAGDYFNFGLNDILSVKEDTLKDSASFLLLSYNRIILKGFGVDSDDYNKSHYISISTRDITLIITSSFPSGGLYKRTIHLKR